jgi:hypothetical protein
MRLAIGLDFERAFRRFVIVSGFLALRFCLEAPSSNIATIIPKTAHPKEAEKRIPCATATHYAKK